MARLIDPKRLLHYQTALRFWHYNCYIHWEQLAGEWVRRELEGITPRELARLMYEHERSGGEIDEVVERRAEWRDEFEFHHDVRLSLPSGRRVYIETRLLMGDDPEDTEIRVVNVHDV